jgi:hypothetical protein
MANMVEEKPNADADRPGNQNLLEQRAEPPRGAAVEDTDRPSTGRTSSFGWSHQSRDLSSARDDGAETPETAVFRADRLAERIAARQSEEKPALEPCLEIDRVMMSSLRMLAHHAGLQLSQVEDAYRGCCLEGRDDFAAFFCKRFAESLQAPMDDAHHVGRVYLPEGFPSRPERRHRLMALHSRIHILEVELSLQDCVDRDNKSRDADLPVFSAFVSANASRLPASFPSLQELLELLP